jgi:enamine deaminase RidA (YjgF/YER057c/UK114 family)
VKQQRFSPRDRRGGAAQAVRAGNLVLVGGLMPLDAQGRVVGSDVATQARHCFESLERVLAEAGAGMADVVKHNIYFDCPGDAAAVRRFLDAVDAVRLGYFKDPGPVTTETRLGLDVEGVLLQVDAWAVVGGPKQRLMPERHWGWGRELPFSQGWKCGDLIFVGGQRSLDGAGRLVGEGDIEVQTAEVFRNLETVLQEAGGDRNNLMRQNTFFRFFGQGREVTEYWEKMTNVRRRYMSVPSAAGAGLRITGFANTEELIQVEGIGMLGEDKLRLDPKDHWDWSIPGSQFTQGWRIGPYGFIGGQISADSRAKAVGRDMETQARNVYRFIRRTLAEGGLDESHVAKLYIYYYADGDWADIAATRETIARVQREFYGEPGPAVTAVRVSGFAFEDLLIEIEAFAICPD